MTVADRIAVMDKGRIIQIATPSEIYEQPASRYVAEFIGDVNLFEGVTTAGTGGMHIACSGGALAVHADGELDAAPGATAWFAVRPEKVRISHQPPADPSVNAVSGEVWDIAYLGDVSVFHVRLADGKVVRATLANASRVVEHPIGWDDKVWLSWNRDAGVVLTR